MKEDVILRITILFVLSSCYGLEYKIDTFHSDGHWIKYVNPLYTKCSEIMIFYNGEKLITPKFHRMEQDIWREYTKPISTSQSKPHGRDNYAITTNLIGDTIFINGGFSKDILDSNFWSYSVNSNEWSLFRQSNIQRRTYHQMAYINDEMYIFDGICIDNHNAMMCPLNNLWKIGRYGDWEMLTLDNIIHNGLYSTMIVGKYNGCEGLIFIHAIFHIEIWFYCIERNKYERISILNNESEFTITSALYIHEDKSLVIFGNERTIRDHQILKRNDHYDSMYRLDFTVKDWSILFSNNHTEHRKSDMCYDRQTKILHIATLTT
jgi:hypothetical protein